MLSFPAAKAAIYASTGEWVIPLERIPFVCLVVGLLGGRKNSKNASSYSTYLKPPIGMRYPEWGIDTLLLAL